MWPNSTFEFRTFWIFWNFGISWTSLVFSCHKCPCADVRFSCRFRDFWSLSVGTGFPVLMNSWASHCHPWELDAASGLEFWWVLAPGLPDNPTCRLEALSTPGLFRRIRTVHIWRTCRNRTGQVHRRWPGFRHNPVFFWLSLHPFRHPFGAANQAEILDAAERAEMVDVKQPKKIIPFVTCEVSFSHYVCVHLTFVFDFLQLPCRYFTNCFHSFSTAAFASGIFMASGTGINLCTRL